MSKTSASIPSGVNAAQWEAICYEGGHLLITAGPGTGKTHTITHRIARRLSFLKDNEKICAITFTNKAALEMKERLSHRLRSSLDKVFVGTFHAFCLDVLRSNRELAGLPENFSVIAPEEIERLWKDGYPDVNSQERKKLLKKVWTAKQNGKSIPEVNEYNNLLRQQGKLDYDDLLFEVVELLEKNEAVRQELHTRFPYVFVDEYQDINLIQNQLLKLLTGQNTSVTAIGDPNQAIYSFRGSDVSFFLSFANDFPGAEELSLEDNYRSAPNLLMASGQILERGSDFHVPKLTARIYEQGRLTIHQAPTERGEAEYVVHTIEQMVGGTSMFSQDSGRVAADRNSERSFGDIAVLYRLNSQQYALKAALERSGIPYEISGTKNLENDFLPSADECYEGRTERVKLMTLHASKGLEFPVVFIVGCEESLVPLNLEGLSSDLDEERRLFYVGMTRAKEQLFLVRAAWRHLFGQKRENPPSPFLQDIEDELKEIDASKQQSARKKRETQFDLFGKF